MNISVIIPVYNVEPFIERCLRSIMGQSFSEGVECIIVNDCTPDNSIEIAKQLIDEYKGKIQFRIISHEKNRGLAAARNTGLEASSGTYILHIDSDDYCEPDMLEQLYMEAIRTNADIVCCNIFIEYATCQEQVCYPYVKELRSDLIRLHPIFCAVWNKLVTKELYSKHGITFFPDVTMWEDLGVTCRLRYFSQSTVILPKALYHYNKQNIFSIVSQPSRRKIDEQILCASLLEDFFKTQGELDYNNLAFIISFIKFESKRSLIWDAANRDIVAWKNIYPETNRHIWHYTALSKSIRLTLILAAIGFPKFACRLIDRNHNRKSRN
ncbi:glycosyltransferase family 2 protein [uncultured Parabacteroides sp.]|uniref:glycosyltransferase family 2 protein n=1 Tax=uncultured Parabacteroides sp. TaxID=512312 RepID=UPI0025975ADA|nr:glycosyltransferase family 2 protein [uncultured Parabacteroides sp.]